MWYGTLSHSNGGWGGRRSSMSSCWVEGHCLMWWSLCGHAGWKDRRLCHPGAGVHVLTSSSSSHLAMGILLSSRGWVEEWSPPLSWSWCAHAGVVVVVSPLAFAMGVSSLSQGWVEGWSPPSSWCWHAHTGIVVIVLPWASQCLCAGVDMLLTRCDRLHRSGVDVLPPSPLSLSLCHGGICHAGLIVFFFVVVVAAPLMLVFVVVVVVLMCMCCCCCHHRQRSGVDALLSLSSSLSSRGTWCTASMSQCSYQKHVKKYFLNRYSFFLLFKEINGGKKNT